MPAKSIDARPNVPDAQGGPGDSVMPVVITVPAARPTAWWAMTVVLAVVATAWVMRRDEAHLVGAAMAQMEGSAASSMVGARGIYAFSGQLTSKTHGLFMLDVDTGTVWCYELQKASNNELQLRLVAARSWMFDRYLEEFNTAKPLPGDVRVLVQQQRDDRRKADQETAPPAGIDGPALPDGGNRP